MENIMRKIKLEKVVLNIGGTGEELAKGIKLLKIITGKEPAKTTSRKRIPTLGVRPGLEVGTLITLRGEEAVQTLKRMLTAVDNAIKKKQVAPNHFSFGVKEYIEVPGLEYIREIGIIGFDVTVVFKRAGHRVKLKKVKRGKIPLKQVITPEEIIKYMEENFQTIFEGK